MEIDDGAGSVGRDDKFAARGGQAADNARHAAAYAIGELDARGASGDDLAVALLDLLALVEHAKRENPGMRRSVRLPRGGHRRRGGSSRCCCGASTACAVSIRCDAA